MKKHILSKIKNFNISNLSVMITFAAVAISFLAVLIITTGIYRRFDFLIGESAQQSNAQTANSVAESIDEYIGSMILVSDTVSEMLNNNVIKEKTEAIQYFLRGDIETIAVFDQKGSAILKIDDRTFKERLSVQNQSWFTAVIPGSTLYYISDSHVQQLYQGEYPWVISLSRGVSWVDQDNVSQQGVVLVDLNFSTIKDLCLRNYEDKGYTFIITKENDIIFHPRQQMIYAGIQHDDLALSEAMSLDEGNSLVRSFEKEYYVSVVTLKNANWSVLAVRPKAGLFSYDSEMVPFMTIGISLVIVIALILAIFVSIVLTRPLKRLMIAMKQVEQGELNTVSSIKGAAEIKNLTYSFNQMMGQIQTLMKQLVKEQKQLRKTEIKALHAQINPHFLYNTLDSIVWMAHSTGQNDVARMVEALASFFRMGLSKGNDMITVRDELEHIENYLIIQKMRFDEQFTYCIEASPETLTLYTPNIILQPIVENAVIHGVGNLPYEGKIAVRTYLEKNKLCFEVTDNGFGMPMSKLQDILNAKSSSKSGIGARNVNQRIQILYGKEYGLQYESVLDKGTSVFIRIPMIDRKEEVAE